ALALMAIWQRNRAVEQILVNKRLLYLAQMKLASQELENANIAHVEELVRTTTPTTSKEDFRGFEWYFFRHCAHSEVFRLPELNRIAAVRFAGMNTIAIVEASHAMFQSGRDYTIKLYDRGAHKNIFSFTAAAGRNFDVAAFSPDLTYVATDAPGNSVVLWD